LHGHFTSKPLASDKREHLLVHDRRLMESWIVRAREYVRRREPCPSPAEIDRIDRLGEHYDRIMDRLAELPVSLIHGDFFASNILIDSSLPVPRICPVDWELAAVGPRLMDLASLVAGHWTENQRRELAMAYFTEATPKSDMSDDADALWTDLQFCRLHLAVQMLGWSATWRAGPAHAYDWLGEAIRLADDLHIC
jgi:aminoglycoside phosphotransferase (APT) family kinase protein